LYNNRNTVILQRHWPTLKVLVPATTDRETRGQTILKEYSSNHAVTLSIIYTIACAHRFYKISNKIKAWVSVVVDNKVIRFALCTNVFGRFKRSLVAASIWTLVAKCH